MRADLDSVLKAVSRSFYLTIRMLPPVLREPVGLAYLLARTSDTVADSAGSASADRLEALSQMGAALLGRAAVPDLSGFIPGVPEPSEQELLRRFKEIWRLWEQTEPGDREEITHVLEEILRGQALDLQRFGSCGKEGGVTALATEVELDDYTYSVAGCVGEFWTRICLRHLPRYAPDITEEELIRRGIAFGKGLQLVNILRDAPADLLNGRCYLPLSDLDGHSPEELRAAPPLARAAYERWTERAREHLENGFSYIEAIRPWKLRLACFLPWALGVRTLGLMEQSRPLETARRVKVSRAEVRRLLVSGAVASLANPFLRAIARRLKSRKSA